MNVMHIMEGIKNKFFPEKNKKELIKDISAERLAICRKCPFNSLNTKSFRPDEYCTSCGCNLELKTKSLSSECPENKWLWL